MTHHLHRARGRDLDSGDNGAGERHPGQGAGNGGAERRHQWRFSWVATALAAGCELQRAKVLITVTLTLKITGEALEEAEFPRHVQQRAEATHARRLPKPRLPGALAGSSWERCEGGESADSLEAGTVFAVGGCTGKLRARAPLGFIRKRTSDLLVERPN